MTVLFRTALWGAAVFAFVMAILPRPPEVLGEVSDKYQHALAFIVLAVLAALAYRHARLIVIFGWLALFGAAIEVVQLIPALRRDGDLVDWVVDMLAAAAGLCCVAVARRWLRFPY